MLKEEYVVNICMYTFINNSCICKINTVNHFKFGQLSIWINTEGKILIKKIGQGFSFIELTL